MKEKQLQTYITLVQEELKNCLSEEKYRSLMNERDPRKFETEMRNILGNINKNITLFSSKQIKALENQYLQQEKSVRTKSYNVNVLKEVDSKRRIQPVADLKVENANLFLNNTTHLKVGKKSLENPHTDFFRLRNNISYLGQLHNVTTEKLAQAIGVKAGALFQLLNGKTATYDLCMLMNISNYYDVKLQKLLYSQPIELKNSKLNPNFRPIPRKVINSFLRENMNTYLQQKGSSANPFFSKVKNHIYYIDKPIIDARGAIDIANACGYDIHTFTSKPYSQLPAPSTILMSRALKNTSKLILGTTMGTVASTLPAMAFNVADSSRESFKPMTTMSLLSRIFYPNGSASNPIHSLIKLETITSDIMWDYFRLLFQAEWLGEGMKAIVDRQFTLLKASQNKNFLDQVLSAPTFIYLPYDFMMGAIKGYSKGVEPINQHTKEWRDALAIFATQTTQMISDKLKSTPLISHGSITGSLTKDETMPFILKPNSLGDLELDSNYSAAYALLLTPKKIFARMREVVDKLNKQLNITHEVLTKPIDPNSIKLTNFLKGKNALSNSLVIIDEGFELSSEKPGEIRPSLKSKAAPFPRPIELPLNKPMPISKKKITEQEAKNFLKNIELESITPYKLARKVYPNSSRQHEIYTNFKKLREGHLPTQYFVNKIAKALHTSPEKLLAPPKLGSTIAQKAFVEEAIHLGLNMSRVSILSKISKNQLNLTIHKGVSTFNEFQLLSLEKLGFKLPTLIPFASSKVDIIGLLEDSASKTGFSLSTQQRNEFIACEKIFNDYVKNIVPKKSLPVNISREILDKFYISMKHQWHSSSRVTQSTITNTIRDLLKLDPNYSKWISSLKKVGKVIGLTASGSLLGAGTVFADSVSKEIVHTRVPLFNFRLPENHPINAIGGVTTQVVLDYLVLTGKLLGEIPYAGIEAMMVRPMERQLQGKQTLINLLIGPPKDLIEGAWGAYSESVKPLLQHQEKWKKTLVSVMRDAIASKIADIKLTWAKDREDAKKAQVTVRKMIDTLTQNISNLPVDITEFLRNKISIISEAKAYSQSKALTFDSQLLSTNNFLATSSTSGRLKLEDNRLVWRTRRFHPSAAASNTNSSVLTEFAQTKRKEFFKNTLAKQSNATSSQREFRPAFKNSTQQSSKALGEYKQTKREERMKKIIVNSINKTKPADATVKNINDTVNEKYTALLRSSSNEQAKRLENIFSNRLAANYEVIQQVKDRGQDDKDKIIDLIGTIRNFFGNMREPKEADQAAQQANTLATFQTAIHGFNTIAEIGSRLNNRSIQTIGTMGVAASQVALGLSQFGVFGGASVTGLAMVPAAGAVVGGVVLLSSLFMRRGKKGSLQKGLKALQEQLSEQIAMGFNRVLEGVGIVINNQKFTIELIEQKFRHQDEKLYSIITQNYRIETKVDELNQKMDVVISILQKLGMQLHTKELDALILATELLADGNGIKDRVTYDTKINKALKRIANQLHFSLDENARKLSDKGNNLPGWFHILDFADLLRRSEFIRFRFDLRKVVNLIWWNKVLECYYLVLPQLNKSDELSKKYQRDVLKILQETAEPTKIFLQKISNQDFIHTFLNYYKERFDVIKNSAEEILSIIRNDYSKESMIAFATRCMKLNSKLSTVAWQSVIQEINNNTAEKVNNCHIFNALAARTKEYKILVEEFHFYSHILLSILGIHQNISSLNIVDMDYYKHYTSKVWTEKINNQDVRVHYLDGPTDNLFSSFDYSNNIAVNNVRALIDHLDSIDCFSLLSLNLEKTPISQAPVLLKNTTQNKITNSQLNRIGKNTMPENKIDLKKTIELIQPVFDVVKPAKDKKIVPVLGKTGSGKSTLLNYIYGSEYEEATNEEDGEEYLEFLNNSVPEIFSVGHGVSSATLYPKLGPTKSTANYTYCDTGGFFDNRGESERICIGSVLQILKQSLTKEDPIQGIVLVINYEKIDQRGNPLFEILRTFGKILEKNTDVENIEIIKKSIAFVFTHVKPSVTIKIIKNRLDGFLKHVDAEDKLVRLILTHMRESNNLMISRISAGDNECREQIEQIVASLMPQSKDRFDFLSHNESQERFNQHVTEVAQSYLLNFKDLQSLSESLVKLENEINECSQTIKSLDTKNNGMNKTKEAKRNQLNQFNEQLTQLAQAITTKNNEITVCNIKIAEINQKTTLCTVTTLTHDRAADPQVSVPTTVRTSGKWKYIKNLAGATYDRKGYGWYDAPSKKSVPAPGTTTKDFNYEFSFPTSVIYQNNDNSYVTLVTADTSKGYKGTISYPLGYKTSIDIVVRTQERYLRQNQDLIVQQQVKINELETEKNALEQTKSHVETDKNQLNAFFQNDKSDEEIVQNRTAIELAKNKFEELKKLKLQYLNDMIVILEELNKYQDTFEDVANIIGLLKLENKEVTEFVTNFVNYSEQMKDYIQVVNMNTDKDDTNFSQSLRNLTELKTKLEANVIKLSNYKKITLIGNEFSSGVSNHKTEQKPEQNESNIVVNMAQ